MSTIDSVRTVVVYSCVEPRAVQNTVLVQVQLVQLFPAQFLGSQQ
jgi:hypothetical protein